MKTSGQRTLGHGRRWWDYRWEDEKPLPRGDYFIFVEEAASIRSGGMESPGGRVIGEKLWGARPWRFRSSGITTEKFLRGSLSIDPIDPDAVGPAERRTRRAQLLASFESVALPLIDILVEDDDEALPFLRSILTPGSWYWIGVRRRKVSDDRLFVLTGAPETGDDPGSPGALQFLEAVPPFLEYRLRDIFSLMHVSDVGDGDSFAGEGPPPDDDPRDGGGRRFKLPPKGPHGASRRARSEGAK